MTNDKNGTPRDVASSADTTTNRNLSDRIAAILAEHDGTPTDPWEQREAARRRGETLQRVMSEVASAIATTVECVAPTKPHSAHAPDANAPQWRQLLTSRVLATLPSWQGITRSGDGSPVSTLQLAARIVDVVVDVVGQADEILLQAIAQRDAAHSLAERLTRELAALRVAHAQLGRDFDERATQHHVTAIELERTRDELQQLRIELHRKGEN